MTKRAITVKSFVNKATSTRLTAAGFLAQHRDYLSTGEISSITSPILAQVDSGQLLAEDGLKSITNAVFSHMMNQAVRKAEEQLAKQDEDNYTSKNHLVKLFNRTGNEIKEEAFNLGQDAQRAGERWLLNSEPGSYVRIETLKLKTRNGKPFTSTITREDAFASHLRSKKGPVMKGKPVSANKLGFGVRVKQNHCHFSHG